jgi:hypothetical protein
MGWERCQPKRLNQTRAWIYSAGRDPKPIPASVPFRPLRVFVFPRPQQPSHRCRGGGNLD